MLGLSGIGVALAYVLTILSAVLCIVYGVVNWNKPDEKEEKTEIVEEVKWEQKDPELGGEA